LSAPTQVTIRQLRGPILRDVSRSFFLSLRLLPSPLRDPISLAYLLARATDTLADTADIPVAQRLESLPKLIGAIEGTTPPEAVADLGRSFAPLQRSAAERSLIESLPASLDWLLSMEDGDREDIRGVLHNITRGQMLDLQRFGGATEIRALQSAAELDEYTYLVAGCVGEFWTRICSRKLGAFADRDEAEMIGLGVGYGQALQLTNILRDAGADLRAGRCYLPADELRRAAVEPQTLIDSPAGAERVVNTWREKAEAGMRSGIEYASAIKNGRVRIATALPALIGIRTLRLIRERRAKTISEHVKVQRSDVRSLVLRTICAGGSPRFLRKELAATENIGAACR
jgi:farnesyl-diphosphate farnesyltransferase